MAARIPRPLPERFWEKVDVRGPDECWTWTAGTASHGYGIIARGSPQRGMLLAHRVSYELHRGPIPDGGHILHSCDNRLCVNPAHLSLGTNAANVADMVAKGRQAAGEVNGHAKLTEEQVREIRERYDWYRVTQRLLAAEYGVTRSNIGHIVNGGSWAHVQ